MTAPAADESAKDQRGQNCQSEEDKAGVDRPSLEGVHCFGRLNGRDRFAGKSPLDNVSDHEKIQQDERKPAPTASLGLADAVGFGRRIARLGNRDRSLVSDFCADTTAFHKVGWERGKRWDRGGFPGLYI